MNGLKPDERREVCWHHMCEAPGCLVYTLPVMVFCGKHWRALPDGWRHKLWTVYKPGQEKSWNGYEWTARSKAYQAVVDEGIEFLSKHKRR